MDDISSSGITLVDMDEEIWDVELNIDEWDVRLDFFAELNVHLAMALVSFCAGRSS